MNELTLESFLKAPGIYVDVRSPAEYMQGRIPGAINIPLLDNEARAQVGTAYKKEGREKAVELGFQLVGPKAAEILAKAKAAVGDSIAKVHCWRGGLRSSSVAWALHIAGIKVATLKGGYKTFRRHALSILEAADTFQFKILGGLTGSGKTAILHELESLGEQVLDLEQLACHRGSSFGMLGMPEQPTVEQFENELAMAFASMDRQRPIWIEDESRMIGTCKIPNNLFKAMLNSPLIVIARPDHERVERLYQEYAMMDKVLLKAAVERLDRHLGGTVTKQIIQLIEKGDRKAIDLILHYYDKRYRYSLSKKSHEMLSAEGLTDQEWALMTIRHKQ